MVEDPSCCLLMGLHHGNHQKHAKEEDHHHHHHHQWVIMEGSDHEDHYHMNTMFSSSSSSSSSLGDSSSLSNGTSSTDMVEDASSSSSSTTSSSNSSGPLFKLSDLMNQLPIKTGLSKYYNGKSESFTCLSMVRSIEELGKKLGNQAVYRSRRKMKSSYSSNYGGGLNMDSYKLYTLPKATISKKLSTRNSLSFPPRKGNCRPPIPPLQNKF